jgi:hypothetical protein
VPVTVLRDKYTTKTAQIKWARGLCPERSLPLFSLLSFLLVSLTENLALASARRSGASPSATHAALQTRTVTVHAPLIPVHESAAAGLLPGW